MKDFRYYIDKLKQLTPPKPHTCKSCKKLTNCKISNAVFPMHNAMIEAYEPHIMRLDALAHKAFENADFIAFMKRTSSENVVRLTRTLLLDYLEYKLIDEPYQQSMLAHTMHEIDNGLI